MVGIVLIAIGAILIWAVDWRPDAVNVVAVGWILIVVGFVEALIELAWVSWFRARWRSFDGPGPGPRY